MKALLRYSTLLATTLTISLSAMAMEAGEEFIQQSPFLVSDKGGHALQILNNGTAAFAKRLEMIEKAKDSIEVEYFIYNDDLAGKVFTQALVRKAKQGVKVRILVDASAAVFVMDEYYAKQLAAKGIEIRYYNTAFTLSSKAILYRNHRKMLVVDDYYAIVGGRNIADEYFDLSEEYNFLDRDVYTEGAVALSMRQSFDAFWDAKIVKKPKLWRADEPKIDPFGDRGNADEARHDQWERKTKKAIALVTETEETNEVYQRVLEVGGRTLKQEPIGNCGELVFATDRPGTENNRILWDHLMSILNKTKKSIVADSPYLILKNDGHTFLENLLKSGVDVTILTNSLYSTDAFYTIPVFKNSVKRHIKEGANIYVYTGIPLMSDEFINSNGRKARWGVHAKTAVFDQDTIMIGTFNVDPRSKNLNTELALFCYDSDYLAKALTSDIQRRINSSVKLNAEGVPEDGRGNFHGTKLPKRIMYHLFAPLAHIFDGLL